MARAGESAQARRWAGRAVVGALALFYTLALALYLEAPTDFALLVPGPATDARDMVVSPDRFSPGGGHLLTTTVGAIPRTSVLDLIEANFAPSASRVPSNTLLGTGATPEDFQRTGTKEMAESVVVAQVAALGYAGIPARSDGSGAQVVSVPDPGPSGVQRGDIIVGAGDCQIHTATDVDRCIGELHPGQPVRLLVMRGGTLLSVEVPLSTNSATNGAGEPPLHIGTVTIDPRVVATKQFTIRSGGTLGPSAGLMIALAVLERLANHSLTGWRSIAGTGTISPTGNVGPVGGVAQKVAGAEAAGAEVFLVPRENYAEAIAAAREVHVVPVGTLAEAVDFLHSLNRL